MSKVYKILILFALIFSIGKSNAQYIDTIYTIPSNPTTSSNVRVVADLMFSNSDCLLDSLKIIPTGSHIDIRPYYWQGFLATICYRTDTFDLGTFSSGCYTIHWKSYSYTTGSAMDSATYDTLEFCVGSGTGLSDPDHRPIVNIYPNPASDQLTISATDDDQIESIQLYSTGGKQVLRKKASMNSLSVDVSWLAPGFYYLILQTEIGAVRRKVIIQH